MSPEEGLRILIKEEATFDKIATDNPEALKTLMSQQEIKIIFDIASPLTDVSNEWIKEKMEILFDVMVELRPNLARGIVETPGGKEWFYTSLTGLRKLLFGIPQLNIQTHLGGSEDVPPKPVLPDSSEGRKGKKGVDE